MGIFWIGVGIGLAGGIAGTIFGQKVYAKLKAKYDYGKAVIDNLSAQ